MAEGSPGSLSQESHKGPEGPRESGVFAFCPSVRRHECREKSLRQQQAPRRALSRAIPVVNAQRSGSTHASRKHQLGQSPLASGPCFSLGSVGSRAFVIAGGRVPETHRFRLLRTESERTCTAESIKGHAGSTNAHNKVDGTPRPKTDKPASVCSMSVSVRYIGYVTENENSVSCLESERTLHSVVYKRACCVHQRPRQGRWHSKI